jgi:hypothetical protein
MEASGETQEKLATEHPRHHFLGVFFACASESLREGSELPTWVGIYHPRWVIIIGDVYIPSKKNPLGGVYTPHPSGLFLVGMCTSPLSIAHFGEYIPTQLGYSYSASSSSAGAKKHVQQTRACSRRRYECSKRRVPDDGLWKSRINPPQERSPSRAPAQKNKTQNQT